MLLFIIISMNGKYIKVLDTQIYLYKIGSGPPLLFIHGHRSDVLRWRKMVELLAPHFTVYAPDLPGFGKSQTLPKGKHDLKTLSFYLKALVEKLDLKDLTIGGVSMGGMIGLLLAFQIQRRVRKLILLGTPSSSRYFKFNKKKMRFLKGLFFAVSHLPFSWVANSCIKSNKLLGFLLNKSFPKEFQGNKPILAYEMKEWRIMPAQVYAQTALSSFNFELPKNYKLDIPVIIFATHTDHLVDMDLAVKYLQKKTPVNQVIWLPMKRHVPIGDLDNYLVETLKPYLGPILV